MACLNLRLVGLFAPAGLVLTWSSGFVGAELSARVGDPPLTVLGWRFVVLAGVLITACAATRTSLVTWAGWRRQIVLGLLCQVGFLVCIFEGVSHGVTSGTSALIGALQPLLVASVAGRLLGEKSSATMWLGMAVGFAGVAVVVGGDLRGSDTPLWAFAFPMAGMLSLAAGTVLTRRLRPSETLLQSITMQSLTGAVALMAVAGVAGQASPPGHLRNWLPIVWLVALPSLGGYGLYIYVTRTLGATVVSALLYLTPPTTMLWAFLMFREGLTVLGFVGLLISGVGVFLVLSGRRSRSITVGPAVAATEPTT
ncbi:DMT family transporter [Kribbella sp. NPDC051587]|uniref:DMT family transporter n=1 Tax=Kribbella sp. NPDC051587 TaxID=3364119 RepID=UPI00379A996C